MNWLVDRLVYVVDRLETDDYNMILPNLYLGNKNASKEKILQDLGIDIVINVTPNLPFHSEQIENIGIPVYDDKSEYSKRILVEYIKEILPYMHLQLKRGKRILVHCRAGIQRSPTVIAAYLMKYKGMSIDEAIEFIQARRPTAFRPKQNFRDTLEILDRII